MKLSQYTLDLLNDIEERIRPEVEEDYIAQWKSFWNGEVKDIIFIPKRKILSAPGTELKSININDALEDMELMLDMQLAGVSKALNSPTSALSVRANYGAGIIPTLFGAEIFKMPRSTNTLPTVKAFSDLNDLLKETESGIPDIDRGFGRKVFEFGELCLETFADYPKISKYVTVYHPDTQGPLDIADLLMGNELFYALYDDPDFVHRFMQLITDTYVKFIDTWFLMFPCREDINVHWGFWMKGGICLRNDSAINLSPDQYREFVLKYDRYLLDRYKGIMHYCGKGDHFIGIAAEIEGLTGINLSQPHLNDMEKVYGAAFPNNKKLIALAGKTCAEYEKRSDAVRGMIFGGK